MFYVFIMVCFAFCCTVTSCNHTLDQVDFSSPGDQIIGAGSCDGLALFFSLAHGLVSIQQNNAQNQSM